MHCHNCDEKVNEGAKFCLNCGANLNVQNAVRPKKLFDSKEQDYDEEPTQTPKEKKPNHLEQKWWFRFIKVIYILAYIVAVLLVSFGGYSSKSGGGIDAEKSTIRCNNGKSYSPAKNNISVYSDDFGIFEEPHVRILCAYDTLNFYSYTAPSSKNYSFDVVKKPTNWSPAFQVWFWGFVITILFFEAVRRTFYYIVTGRKFFSNY